MTMIWLGGLLVAVSLGACGGSGAPSDEALCKHIESITEKSGRGCKEELATMKEKLGDKAYKKMATCMMAAKSKGDFLPCVGQVDEVKTYVNKSKTTEARQFLRKLVDAGRAFYLTPSLGMADSLTPVAKQFPGTSVGPTPAKGACCGEDKKCAPDPAHWEHQTWKDLLFDMLDPHYFSYEYKVHEEGPTKGFTVFAYGDLDCDKTYSTFSMSVTVDESGEPVVGEMKVDNELE